MIYTRAKKLIVPNQRLSLIPTCLRMGAAGRNSDPYWANVVALLHFDGADGSTTFTDQTGKLWSAEGGAKISADAYAFGGASLYLPAGAQIKTTGSSDFAFGLGDFTIEGWFDPRKAGSGNGDGIFFSNGINASDGITLALNNNYGLELRTSLSNRFYVPGTTHIASAGIAFLSISRVGSTVYVGVNGQVASYSYDFGNTAFAPEIVIGQSGASYIGYIDDFRITKGVARYTANFTPPTAPFPSA